MFFFLMLLDSVESRVFCQDSHAMEWMPRGYTCPVLCESVRSAIERLIMLDFKKTVAEQSENQDIKNLFVSAEAYTDERMSYRDNLKKTQDMAINEVDNANRVKDFDHMNPFFGVIVKNIRHVKGILRRNSESDNSGVTNDIKKYSMTKKCWVLQDFQPKLLLGKIVRQECSRKSNFDQNFLTTMTGILNRYTNTFFKFTDGMTEILLESIFGNNKDLGNNIFDVNKLLKYLRNSLNLHKNHTNNEIILKSRHCMSISLPGCFCRRGFVENSGQCVDPSDCVKSKYYTKYLSRIVVL